MKKIGVSLTGALFAFAFCAPLFAQDTAPRGWSQWTARNWIGFFIYLGLFVLAVIGIYKLAGVDEIPEEETERKLK